MTVDTRMSTLSRTHLFGLLVSLTLLFQRPASAVKVVVGPGRTECVYETITAENFDVPGGARLDGRVLVSSNNQYYAPFVTVQVVGPSGEQLYEQHHVYSDAHFNVPARGPGTYRACFFNPWESRTDAVVDMVYFTLAHLRRPAGVTIPKGTSADREKEVAQADHMEECRRTILGMTQFMQVISGTQKYLQRKLDRHKETMVSSNSRTMWYALLETAVLILATGTQVYMIRKFFESGKVRITLGV